MTPEHLQLIEATRQQAPELERQVSELILFAESASADYDKIYSFSAARDVPGGFVANGRWVDCLIRYAERLEMQVASLMPRGREITK